MRSELFVRNCRALHFIAASLLLAVVISAGSCQRKQEISTGRPASSPSATATPSPVQQTSPVEVRYYQGSGIVTKVVRENPYDKSLASVELDHGEIVGLMPPMRMEFYVKHVSLLDGLKIGDVVDFTIEEKGATEIISELKKK